MVTSPLNRNRDFSKGVPFTQFLMPDGRRHDVWIDGLAPDVVAKAKEIVEAGYVFECEMLHDYNTVSFTISDDAIDAAQRVCTNGPDVPEKIAEMILSFCIETANREEIR